MVLRYDMEKYTKGAGTMSDGLTDARRGRLPYKGGKGNWYTIYYEYIPLRELKRSDYWAKNEEAAIEIFRAYHPKARLVRMEVRDD